MLSVALFLFKMHTQRKKKTNEIHQMFAKRQGKKETSRQGSETKNRGGGEWKFLHSISQTTDYEPKAKDSRATFFHQISLEKVG